MTTSSPLLTKLRRPIIILLQFILGNRRKGMLEDLLEVLNLDLGCAKFLRGDIPERQPLSSAAAARVVLPGRIRGKLRRTARAAGVVLAGDQISLLVRTELLRLLTSSQRLHQRLLHHDLDIGTRRSLSNLSQRFVILVRQIVGRVAHVELHHEGPCLPFGKRNIHSFFESTANGGIQFPRYVCGAEDKDVAFALSNSVHLHQKLGLDTPSGITFALGSATAERINLINEDDGPSSVRLACHLE
mmetsp:Transcript_11085/g.26103  ORF Transcript_11085/g.26103 Transcript_11085/m.26103 type:complete len:244 (+) Transcript_11085:172-903(+)